MLPPPDFVPCLLAGGQQLHVLVMVCQPEPVPSARQFQDLPAAFLDGWAAIPVLARLQLGAGGGDELLVEAR